MTLVACTRLAIFSISCLLFNSLSTFTFQFSRCDFKDYVNKVWLYESKRLVIVIVVSYYYNSSGSQFAMYMYLQFGGNLGILIDGGNLIDMLPSKVLSLKQVCVTRTTPCQLPGATSVAHFSPHHDTAKVWQLWTHKHTSTNLYQFKLKSWLLTWGFAYFLTYFQVCSA